MATTKLSPGVSVATSSTITVSGSPVKVGLYVNDGNVPKDCIFQINASTPDEPNPIGQLRGDGDIETVIAGDGEYTVTRMFAGAAQIEVGVYSSEAGD